MTIFDSFGQKNPQFWIFQRIPLLKQANRHLEENFRKFSAKNNDNKRIVENVLPLKAAAKNDLICLQMSKIYPFRI